MDDLLFPLTTTVRQLFTEGLPQYDYPWIISVARRIQSPRYSADAIVSFWYMRNDDDETEGNDRVLEFPCRAAYEKFVWKSLRGCALDLAKVDRRFQETIQKYLSSQTMQCLHYSQLPGPEVEPTVLSECYALLSLREQFILDLKSQGKTSAEIANLWNANADNAPIKEGNVRQIRSLSLRKLQECIQQKGGN